MNLFKISVFVFFYSLITNTYAVKIETDLEKLSYSMGIYFGQTVNSQEMEIDIPAFMQAVEDVLNNAEKKMTDDEMKKILSTYQKMEQDQRAAESDSNKIKGKKYLAENKDKEGVITLPSGLQYKIIKNSEGEKPLEDSRIVVHYRGTLIDGTEFDSSYSRGEPIELNLNQVIKGWTEAMQLMVKGDKFELYIPSTLAYGESGRPPKINGGATLIFKLELIEIKGEKIDVDKNEVEEGKVEEEEVEVEEVEVEEVELIAPNFLDFLRDDITRMERELKN